MLEPEGTVTVQFKQRDIVQTMKRIDPLYNELFKKNGKEDIPKELQDRSENTPENENEEDAPKKYEEAISCNKKRYIENVELDESNEEAKVVKIPKQTIAVLDSKDTTATGNSNTSEQIGNYSDPMETCDQSDEGKDDM